MMTKPLIYNSNNVYLWKCSLVSGFIDITGTRCKQLKILGIVLENRTFVLVSVNDG